MKLAPTAGKTNLVTFIFQFHCVSQYSQKRRRRGTVLPKISQSPADDAVWSDYREKYWGKNMVPYEL